MPNGGRFVFDTTFPIGVQLPDLSEDPRLRAGSLLLINPADEHAPWDAGVPAVGQTIPNLAWPWLADYLGSGDEDTLAATFANSLQGADAYVGRTPRGALEIIYRQAGGATSGRGAAVRTNTAIRTHIRNNPTHSYFYSLWGYLTRIGIANGSISPPLSHFTSNASATSNHFFINYERWFSGATGASFLIQNGDVGRTIVPATPAVGTLYRGVGFNDCAGSLPGGADEGSFQDMVAVWGGLGPFGSFMEDKGPSFVFMGAYLEDLTVSGRTYAEAEAQDYALFLAALASGGVYNGDTYTAVGGYP